jgi:hypothetical protein
MDYPKGRGMDVLMNAETDKRGGVLFEFIQIEQG